MAGLVKLQPIDFAVTKGPRATFAEGVSAGFAEAKPMLSGGRMLEDEIVAPVRSLLQDVMPANMMRGGTGSGRGLLSDDLARRVLAEGGDRISSDTLRLVLGELDQVGYEYSEALRPEAMEARRADRLGEAADDRAKQQEIMSRAGVFGPFLGAVGAEFTDPFNLATIPVGAPARSGLALTVAVEAMLNAVIEGGQTPSRNRLLKEMGEPEEGVGWNMLIGGAFGAAMPLAIAGGMAAGRGGVSVVNSVTDFVQSNREARRVLAKEASASNSPAAQDAANTILRDLEDEEAAVASPGPEDLREYHSRAEEAHTAAVEGRAPDMPERPLAAAPRVAEDGSQLVDPRELLVQPDVFQFKSEIVAEGGVTPKLQGVVEWVPHRAGVAIVYEYADGSRAIADGHQRTALARPDHGSRPKPKHSDACRGVPCRGWLFD